MEVKITICETSYQYCNDNTYKQNKKNPANTTFPFHCNSFISMKVYINYTLTFFNRRRVRTLLGKCTKEQLSIVLAKTNMDIK